MDDQTSKTRDKAGKFLELAEPRVTRALNIIRTIGNLANRSSYDYKPDQIAKMFKTLRAELDIAERRFIEQPQNKSRDFRF